MSVELMSDIDRRIFAEFSEKQRELIDRCVVRETDAVTELLRAEFVRIIKRMVDAAGDQGPLVRGLADLAIAAEEQAIVEGTSPA
jgi:hypothetical protein